LNEVQSRWAFIRGALESLGDEDITINFLRHALTVMHGHLTAAEVYETVQEIAKTEQMTVTLTTQLESLATAYVATFNPEHERWNGYSNAARSAIHLFNLFNIKPMRPLLLAIAARMEPKPASECFTFLVSLGVRLMIATTVRSGSVEVPLTNAARDVFTEQVKSLDELKAKLKGLTPSDQEFLEAFKGMRVSNARLARYYLRSLEMAAKQEPEPWFEPKGDSAVINLEHVLPLKTESNWPYITEDDIKLYARRLGNLVLMRASDNSNARSSGFDDKRPLYAASPYLLTSQVAEAKSWTPSDILTRQTRLADLALATWPTT
jgi:hypothetical protein